MENQANNSPRVLNKWAGVSRWLGIWSIAPYLILAIIYLIVIISMIFLYNREYKKLLKELIKKEDEINEIYSKILK